MDALQLVLGRWKDDSKMKKERAEISAFHYLWPSFWGFPRVPAFAETVLVDGAGQRSSAGGGHTQNMAADPDISSAR